MRSNNAPSTRRLAGLAGIACAFSLFAIVITSGQSPVFADQLFVTASTTGMDNLIGATANWQFTASTSQAVSPGSELIFTLPGQVVAGTPFGVCNAQLVSVTSSGYPAFNNIYQSTTSPVLVPGIDNLCRSGQGPDVLYGFTSTTTAGAIPAHTTFSVIIGGIVNPQGMYSMMKDSGFQMGLVIGTSTFFQGGSAMPSVDNNGNLQIPQSLNTSGPGLQFSNGSGGSVGTTTYPLTRAGGALVSDANSALTLSSYNPGAAATATISITLGSNLPDGSKIGINIPSAYSLQNATTSLAAISTSSAEQAGYFATTTAQGANRVILTTYGGNTVPAGNTVTVSVGGLTNPSSAGVYGTGSNPFALFTAKPNGGLIDGSYLGYDQGDYQNGPSPVGSVHVGGHNNLILQVFKSNGNGGTTTLSASDIAQLQVAAGCMDKQFFMGERYLDSNGVAQYNNILDCNYMIGVMPSGTASTSLSFYQRFLPPGFQSVNLVAPSLSVGQTATATLVFGLPDSTTTIELAGGVPNQQAFINAYSENNQSYSPVFTDKTYTTTGFNSAGEGFAAVQINSNADWNFNLVAGSGGGGGQGGGNFSDSSGNQYWPPSLPGIRLAAASSSADLGTSTYVLANRVLQVTLDRTGGGNVTNACVGVMRTGGGVFTGPQESVCSPNDGNGISYDFKVPATTTVEVQVSQPGMGQPQQFPAVIKSVGTTTQTVVVSSPTSYITVNVSTTANGTTTPVSGAPVFAQGDGFSQDVTNSSGRATLYVPSGVYTVQGFVPGLGPLSPQSGVTVTGGSNPTVNFSISAASLMTISGQVTQNGVGVSGVSVGAHGVLGTSGGNSTQTDGNGDYTLYVPSGIYQVGGWSPSTGSFSYSSNVDVTSGSQGGVDFVLQQQGTLRIEVENASDLDHLYAGAFNSTTGLGNGTNSWVASTTAPTDKVAYVNLPAGTYDVHAGSPSTGELPMQSGVTIAAGQTITATFNAASAGTLVNLSGQVLSGGSGVSGVNVWASRTDGPGFFTTQTDSNGNYVLSVPAQKTYHIGISSGLYTASQGDTGVYVGNGGVSNENFVVNTNNSTITGTVQSGSGASITGGWITGIRTSGAASTTQIGGPVLADGSFSLNVPSGSSWNLYASAPCYDDSAAVPANAGDSGKTVTISATNGCSLPKVWSQSILDTAGGVISSSSVTVNIPPNVLGSSQSYDTVSISSAGDAVASANATPVGGAGVTISAIDSSGNPITKLNGDVTITISYDPTLLPVGYDPSKLQLGYFDTNTGTWDPISATVSTSTHTITYQVDHFTQFGPIMQGAPAAPTGLSASSPSTSEIDLSWTASPTATSYTVYQSSTDSNYTTSIASGIAGTTYSNTGLSASTRYYYEVAGVNSNGEGPNSSSANAETNAVSSGSSAAAAVSGGGGGSVSAATLAGLLAPSASSTAYLNSLASSSAATTVIGCPAGYTCTPAAGASAPAAAPAAVPAAAYVFSRPLHEGMSGDDVAALQSFLVSEGYLIIPSGVSRGYFGALTKAAVESFQKANGIEAIGVFGPQTTEAVEKLMNGTPGASGNAAVPASSASAAAGANGSAGSLDFTRSLYVGESGADISALQDFLVAHGYLVIPAGVSRGYFGALTEAAVKVFQKEMGIEAIGTVGPETKAAMARINGGQ